MDKIIIPIGVYDRTLDLFENQYPTPEGISYNSYIINDSRKAVIDTVDKRMAEEWRAQILAELPDCGPDYLIVQHLEPDHASQIAWLMDLFPTCRMVCTSVAAKMLPYILGSNSYSERTETVADGDTLSLGTHTLQFITAPMIHWPEVMMILDTTSGTLFSADAFGRFGAPDPSQPWACEARRYYFNIVGKYGAPVLALLKKLSGKDIRTIAPLHGPVLEGDISSYLKLYATWAAYEPEEKGVLVAYASIHGMTAEAAHYLADELRAAGFPKVVECDLTRDSQSEAIEDAFRYSHLAVLASTYDGHIFPPMHDFIHHLALKGYSNRAVGIVENGLWAPAAARLMRGMFENMKNITLAGPIVTLRGRLTPDSRAELSKLADALAADLSANR